MIKITMAEQVKLTLGEKKEARDNDQILYKEFIKMWHKKKFIEKKGEFYVLVSDDVPQQQDVARCRRKLQEAGFFVASKKVRDERMKRAKKVTEVLSGILKSTKKDLNKK